MDLHKIEDSIGRVDKAMGNIHKSSLKFAKKAHDQLEKAGKPIPEFLKKLMDEAEKTNLEYDKENPEEK